MCRNCLIGTQLHGHTLTFFQAHQPNLTTHNSESGLCERNCNPVSGPASDVANFLAELYEEGYQASSLNFFRSAISSAHNQVDGVTIGKHPMICHVLKGAFSARLPLPHYTATWNVQVVLNYLEGLGASAPYHSNFLPLSWRCCWH